MRFGQPVLFPFTLHTSKVDNFVREQNDEGIEPVKELDCSSNVFKLVARESPEGIDPANVLLFSFKTFIEVRFPKDPEIVPVSP